MWQEFSEQLAIYWPFDQGTSWMLRVFLIVFMTMLVNYFSNRLFRRLHQRLMQTDTVWDDLLLSAARRPIAALICFR